MTLSTAAIGKRSQIVTAWTEQRIPKRNAGRIASEFMFGRGDHASSVSISQFVISKLGARGMRSQIVTSNPAAKAMRSQSVTSNGRGGTRQLPYAFTEQGVVMLSSVLRSQRAVEVNIAIMRTFVQLRRLMDSNRDLARKIEAMEKRYDEQFAVVFDAIKQLIADDRTRKTQSKRSIGFTP